MSDDEREIKRLRRVAFDAQAEAARHRSAGRTLARELEQAQDERDDLAAQIAKVRTFHVSDGRYCYGCYTQLPGYADDFPKWPCATIRILDGEEVAEDA